MSAMSGIDPATLERLGLAGGSPTKAARSDRLGQDQFLELMLAQLKNQDPLKPLQSGEFLSQIAQFNTATGVRELQASFGQLAGALYSNQALQASTLVGRTVLVAAPQAVLADGRLQAAVELPDGAPDVQVGIYDAAGQLVRRLSLGSRPAGMAGFTWDGRADSGATAPPGAYQVRAQAMYYGTAYAVPTYVPARVESVSLGGAGQAITLNLTGLGAVDFGAVREIR